ncbi:MAG: hypothetical protein HZR80_20500 [Candidatus Heimdallarchaeota archaeon]
MTASKKSTTKPKTKTSNAKKTSTKSTGKKTTTKKGGKESVILKESKNSLESLTDILNQTAMSLPSLVSTREVDYSNLSSILMDKFEMDIELIVMLEEFFRRLVLLLRYRSSYDQKLNQISRHIKNLNKSNSVYEFRGILQLLGIVLQETQEIVRNYEEMYHILFTEQAMLQFQLMEQLLLFRERDMPHFNKLFKSGIEIFLKVNEKVSKIKE